MNNNIEIVSGSVDYPTGSEEGDIEVDKNCMCLCDSKHPRQRADESSPAIANANPTHYS